MTDTGTATTDKPADQGGGGATDDAAKTKQAADKAAESEVVTEGEKALGDPGKKALDAMKTERNTARDELTKLRADLDAERAKAAGKEAEHAQTVEAQRVKDEALAAADERILRAEIRVAAKGKLTDPNDAFRFSEDIDLSAFESNVDGEYDAAEITAAIDRLIEKKPYLAAQGGKRFQGGADGGARNDTGKSVDEQIAEATKAGNHRLAISLKRQKAYASS
jgi:hypothetical protein